MRAARQEVSSWRNLRNDNLTFRPRPRLAALCATKSRPGAVCACAGASCGGFTMRAHSREPACLNRLTLAAGGNCPLDNTVH